MRYTFTIVQYTYYNETSHSKRSYTKICSSGRDFQEHIIASLKKTQCSMNYDFTTVTIIIPNDFLYVTLKLT